MVTMRICTGGLTIHTRRTRIDYWHPRAWVPLTSRPQRKWWGTTVRTRR